MLQILFVVSISLFANGQNEVTQDENVTLTWWSMWLEDEAQADVVRSAVSAYEDDNPDVTVDVQFKGREVRNMIIAALEAGEEIDITDMDPAVATLNYSDYFLPLDEYLTDDILGILPNSLVYQDLTPQGKVLAIPTAPYIVAVFYNKDHFKEAGISSEPETWDEFLDVCEKLKSIGKYPITFDSDAYTDVLLGYGMQRAVGYEGFHDAMNDKTGESWKDSRVLAMAEAFETLWDDGNWDPNTPQYLFPAGQQELALGNVTMYVNGSWFPSEVLPVTGTDFNWGTFSFPMIPEGVSNNHGLMMGTNGSVIVAKSLNPSEAFELISYTISEDIQKEYVEKVGGLPVHVDVNPQGPLVDASKLVVASDFGMGWAAGLYDAGELAGNVFIPTFRDLVLGTISAEDFVLKMADGTAEFYSTTE